MRHHALTLLTILVAACMIGQTVQAEPPEPGKGLYVACAQCHGENGEGKRAFGAPRLAGQYRWYLVRQLENFKKGIRGFDPKNQFAAQMRQAIGQLDDSDVKDTVEYVRTLEAAESEATVVGDVDNGKEVYQDCIGCHGAEAQGKKRLKTARLNQQYDWYLLRQLMNFRNDLRGLHPEDRLGRRMIKVAKNFPHEQEIRDVVAYIKTLD